MVRILNRVGEVHKELEEAHKDKLACKLHDSDAVMRFVIASKDMDVKSGENVTIGIDKIEIPGKNVCIISSYATNPYGQVIAVGGETHIPIELDKAVDACSFSVVRTGSIKKGDLLGIILLVPVSINIGY